MTISIKNIPQPQLDNSKIPIMLTEETIAQRKNIILSLMKEHGYSTLIIYADKEHGGNFEYLTGFIPRFEEALQVLTLDGTSTLILGNENYNKTKYSLTPSQGILCPLFSLPNQPFDADQSLGAYLDKVIFDESGKIGLVDWKLLPADAAGDHYITAMPQIVTHYLEQRLGADKLVNASHIYLGPSHGARVTNNANEIAHYEYGASLASDSLLSAMNALEVGVSELTVGDFLQSQGQYPNVVTIAAFGERFLNANIYPRANTLKSGDKVALTVSYKGGLSSRNGYAVVDEDELENRDPNYLEEVVFPYYEAYLYWLKHVKIGLDGGAFYDQFNDFYPQSTYGWDLNPGHLVADEEWLSSPFYKNSNASVQSGMIFQVDFIPQQSPHNGVSCESTVAIADQALRNQLEAEYPELWSRIIERKAYLRDYLNIDLSEELLPLASTLGYYRPFLLNQDAALVVDQE